MELKVYSINGSETGRAVNLDESIFGIEPNDHAIYLEAEMIDMLKEAGFEHIKCRRITPFSYVCAGRKPFLTGNINYEKRIRV